MPQNATLRKPPEDMSLEELETEVLARAQEMSDLAEQRYGVGLSAAPASIKAMEGMDTAPAVEPIPVGAAPVEEAPMGVEGEAPPEVVASATAMLVAAGLLVEPSETLTPEVLSVLAQLAEQFAPGLYDMANPAHVTEILDGIINGTIPIAASAPEPGPEPAGGPELGPGPEPVGERPSGLPYGGIY